MPSDAVKEQLIMRKLCTTRQCRKDAFLEAGVRVTRNQSENYRGEGILEPTSQDLRVSKVSRWREGGAPVSTSAVLPVQVTDHMRLREILRISQGLIGRVL